MSLKAQLEAIIYAAETPVTLDQIFQLVKGSIPSENGEPNDAEARSQVRAALEELITEFGSAAQSSRRQSGILERRQDLHVDFTVEVAKPMVRKREPMASRDDAERAGPADR